MLTVGIHDNITVSKAEVNEHGTLEIEFKRPGSEDAMGALTGNVELTPEQSVNIRVYKQEVEYFGEKREGSKMLGLITSFKGVLTELLQIYIDNPVIDATKGLQVTKDNVSIIFTDQANVDIAYNNICNQFCEMIAPYLNSDESFRVKLPRRSKKHAFASLPNYGPWVESMAIPKESSKLKWSNWEIQNGKNDSTPQADTAPSADVSAQVENLDAVFAKKE